jgi:hypothetical protein
MVAFCQPLKRNEPDFDAVMLDEEKAPREPAARGVPSAIAA